MSKLEPGLYSITAVGSGKYVGRKNPEDLSLRPKPIVLLPDGMPVSTFTVQKLDNGHYKLLCNRDHTAAIDHDLFAILLETPPAEEWIITPRKSVGIQVEDVYTIEKHDMAGGWVVHKGEDLAQVAVRPLIAFLSFPPQFPKSELFKFTRILVD